MNTRVNKTATSSGATRSHLSSPQLPFSYSPKCTRFLNWNEKPLESEREKAVVFRSLVDTVKIQPVLDVSLEAKAVKFLESVIPWFFDFGDTFLSSLASSSDDSSPDFVQSFIVLLSSTNQAITTAAMKMLHHLTKGCSPKVRLALVKADLVPQIIATLNPQSLSFTEAVDIHVPLMSWIPHSFWLTTPNGLASLRIEDHNEQQTVHETVLKQVVVPSEQYFRHLCVNRYSIVDDELSEQLMQLLTRLLQICPYYQPTMEFVLTMPVILTASIHFSFQLPVKFVYLYFETSF